MLNASKTYLYACLGDRGEPVTYWGLHSVAHNPQTFFYLSRYQFQCSHMRTGRFLLSFSWEWAYIVIYEKVSSNMLPKPWVTWKQREFSAWYLAGERYSVGLQPSTTEFWFQWNCILTKFDSLRAFLNQRATPAAYLKSKIYSCFWSQWVHAWWSRFLLLQAVSWFEVTTQSQKRMEE